MSLRTRLIIAFVGLSVVPLSAVTGFWYVSSVRAFERGAEREAAEIAVEIGRRMETVTRALGRRVDRLFEASTMEGDEPMPDPEHLQAQVAPLLGDTAVLIDRLEFHPMGTPAPPSRPASGTLGRNEKRDVPLPPSAGRIPPTPDVGAKRVQPGMPPAPPKTIVMDVPKIMEEARRGARSAAAAAGVDVGAAIDSAIVTSLPAVHSGATAGIQAATRAAEAAAGEADRIHVDVRNRRIEVAVRKHGRVVGMANATLNMERTMPSVLALVRRDRGEIPFAVDQKGAFYTPDSNQRGTLEQLDIVTSARAAATGTPRRIADWIVVSRTDPSGLIFGIARPVGESLREIRRMSWRNLSIGLLVIALACIGIVPISHRMTQHVSSLNEGVRQLAGGDFKARVPVRSRDEFGALAAAFNRMAEDLERHQALVVEQERLRRELELSRLIQTEMLPRAPLRLGPAEIKGVSIPAREVGGDFFNYFPLTDGRMALLVGDVSGKGVSAALLMANVQATLRARLPLETELARLADSLDGEIDAGTPRGVYLTLFMGILDVEHGIFGYVNAGHHPQFLIKSRGGIIPMPSTGLPIALLPGKGYAEARVEIAPGDLLFFYTDGLVETENERGDMFGAERLQGILAAERDNGIEAVLERVEQAVRLFRGGAELFDDATMMALRVHEGRAEGATGH